MDDECTPSELERYQMLVRHAAEMPVVSLEHLIGLINPAVEPNTAEAAGSWSPTSALPSTTRDEVGLGSYTFSLTPGFEKALQSVDKKMKGRILEAIASLTSEPTTLKGDTVKPLTRDRRGFWRYRIGDYRLVYQPMIEARRILLVDFSPRASAYSD
jgi:mRNA interferase RelE/StbE